MLKKLIETCVHGLTQAVEEQLPDPDAFVIKPFKRVLQFDGHTCGLRSTEMLLKHHRIPYDEDRLREELKTDEDGTSPGYIDQALRRRGLVVRKRQRLRKDDLHQYMLHYQAPAIVGLMNGTHYGVVFGVSEKHVWVADPLPHQVATRWPWKRFQQSWDGEAVFACRPRRRSRKKGGGMIGSIKDAVLAKAVESLVNKHLEGVGACRNLHLDTGNRSVTAALHLHGEHEPITIRVLYKINKEHGETVIQVTDLTASRHWLTSAFKRLPALKFPWPANLPVLV